MLGIIYKHLKRNEEDLACGRQNNSPPKEVHISIPGSCGYMTSHDKRDFADVLKVRELEMVVPISSYMSLKLEEEDRRECHREMRRERD